MIDASAILELTTLHSLKVDQPHAVELFRGRCEVTNLATDAARYHQHRSVIRPAHQVGTPLDSEGGDIRTGGVDDGEVHTDAVV